MGCLHDKPMKPETAQAESAQKAQPSHTGSTTPASRFSDDTVAKSSLPRDAAGISVRSDAADSANSSGTSKIASPTSRQTPTGPQAAVRKAEAPASSPQCAAADSTATACSQASRTPLSEARATASATSVCKDAAATTSRSPIMPALPCTHLGNSDATAHPPAVQTTHPTSAPEERAARTAQETAAPSTAQDDAAVQGTAAEASTMRPDPSTPTAGATSPSNPAAPTATSPPNSAAPAAKGTAHAGGGGGRVTAQADECPESSSGESGIALQASTAAPVLARLSVPRTQTEPTAAEAVQMLRGLEEAQGAMLEVLAEMRVSGGCNQPSEGLYRRWRSMQAGGVSTTQDTLKQGPVRVSNDALRRFTFDMEKLNNMAVPASQMDAKQSCSSDRGAEQAGCS